VDREVPDLVRPEEPDEREEPDGLAADDREEPDDFEPEDFDADDGDVPDERDDLDAPDERDDLDAPDVREVPDEPDEREEPERDDVPDARDDDVRDDERDVDVDDLARPAVLELLAAAGRREEAEPERLDEAAVLRDVVDRERPGVSSAATRRARLSISPRRPRMSSRTRSSSIVSRRRAAARVTSSTRSRERFCPTAAPAAAPSAVAWNVRSTAPRTASTASDAPRLDCVLFVAIAGLYSPRAWRGRPTTCGRARRSPSACSSPVIPVARCAWRSSCSTGCGCSTTIAACGATPARPPTASP